MPCARELLAREVHLCEAAGRDLLELLLGGALLPRSEQPVRKDGPQGLGDAVDPASSGSAVNPDLARVETTRSSEDAAFLRAWRGYCGRGGCPTPSALICARCSVKSVWSVPKRLPASAAAATEPEGGGLAWPCGIRRAAHTRRRVWQGHTTDSHALDGTTVPSESTVVAPARALGGGKRRVRRSGASCRVGGPAAPWSPG